MGKSGSVNKGAGAVTARRETGHPASTRPRSTRRESTRAGKADTDPGRVAAQIFAANERMNEMLIEHLEPAVWRASPPGKVRTIAAIFTHVHNVRTKWVRLTAPHLKVPRQLDRAHCTPKQALAGLAESAARCEEMLAEALGTRNDEDAKSGSIPPFATLRMGHPGSALGMRGDEDAKSGGIPPSASLGMGHPGSAVERRRIEVFRRDGWARPWPVGVEMLCYMLSHEAHHRGQVCMLAHQLGFPLPPQMTSRLWSWETLWKECGARGGPGSGL